MRKVDTPLIVRLCLPQFAVGLFTTMRTEAAFPYAAAVSFILPAGTDARQFTELSDAVIRSAPIDIDKQQYASVQGIAPELSGVRPVICRFSRRLSAVRPKRALTGCAGERSL